MEKKKKQLSYKICRLRVLCVCVGYLLFIIFVKGERRD